jgi:hypothetical protein
MLSLTVAASAAFCAARRVLGGGASTRRLRTLPAVAAVLCAVFAASEWSAPLPSAPALRLQRGIAPLPGDWPAPYARAPLAGCPAAYLAHLDAYVAWHAATLASLKIKASGAPRGSLPLPVPVVVYRCGLTDECGGVGDRVSGLTAMFYHYGLRLRALFLIDMPAWAGSVQPSTFNWDFPGLALRGDGGGPEGGGGSGGEGGGGGGASWLAAYAGVTVRPPQTGNMLQGGCVNLTEGFPCMHTLDSTHYNATGKPPPEMPLAPGLYAAVTNRGVWSNFNGHRSIWTDQFASWNRHRLYVSRLGLDAENWGCLYRSLIWPTLPLVHEIAEDIAPLAAKPVALCVHHRSGDDNMRAQGLWAEGFGESADYFACAREALRLLNGSSLAPEQQLGGGGLQLFGGNLAAEQVHVYLSADSASIKAEAKSLLGVPGFTVATSSVVPQHSDWREVWERPGDTSPTSVMRSSMRDWFTLGACPAFAGSLKSGFVRSAAVFSGSKALYAPVPNSCTEPSCVPLQLAQGASCAGFSDIGPWLGMLGACGA